MEEEVLEDSFSAEKQTQMAHVPMIRISAKRKHKKIQKYTLKQAKSFQHDLKLTDEDSLKAIEIMNVYKRDQFRIIQTICTPREEITSEMQKILNKLNANVSLIIKNADKLIHSNYFGTDLFLEIFPKQIVETTINQPAFAQVYTRFLQEIFVGLQTDAQKGTLLNNIYSYIFDSPEENEYKCFFIGCLVPAHLVDTTRAMDLVNKLLSNVTTKSMECLFHLMIFAAKFLEKSCDDFEDIISKMTSAACNTDVKQCVRFRLLDLLDARLNNWENCNLMPSLVKINGGEMVKEEPKPVEEDSLLKKYIKNGEITEQWKEEDNFNLIHEICLTSSSDYEKGIKIFKELKEKDVKVFLDGAMQALRDVLVKVDTKEVIQSFPFAVKTIGAIFIQLVLIGFDINIFGTKEFPFNLSVFNGLVSEVDRIEREDLLTGTVYMKEMRFIPVLHSHSQILNELEEVDMTHVWPVYDAMNTVFKMIKSDENPEFVTNYLNIYLNQRVAKNKFLVEFITEFIVIQGPTKYRNLLEFIAKRPFEALSHIETLGEFFGWKPEQTAANIRRISLLIKCDIDNFKELTLREFHKTVIKYL